MAEAKTTMKGELTISPDAFNTFSQIEGGARRCNSDNRNNE
jgi:hypothetical protein